MPARPNKRKPAAPVKPSAAQGGALFANRRADERRRELAARATLGKFQGRKSI
jgi:hypothetical protein